MLNYSFTAEGLVVHPSAESSANDFDFLVGQWQVHNRRLKNDQWVEFNAEIHLRKTLTGLGNVENYYAVFDGYPFEGQAIRLFNPSTKLWTIYWMDTTLMEMDRNPVVGSFTENLGQFFALVDTPVGKQMMIYQWDKSNPANPIWSQALSADEGKSWIWNWEMRLTRSI